MMRPSYGFYWGFLYSKSFADRLRHTRYIFPIDFAHELAIARIPPQL